MKKIITLISLGMLFSINAQADDDLKQYEVSITNATTSHVFTPTFLATHNSRINLFKIGEAASDGLAQLAETGSPALLATETQARHGVMDTLIGTFIHPGETLSYQISASRKSQLSLAAMLATSNDAFMSLNGVALPKKSATYHAHVYDAGSETNNEDCAYIPGPPCSPDSGNIRSETSEGFVSLHKGIHGVGDLDFTQLDWRGPVAIVNIKRVKD